MKQQEYGALNKTPLESDYETILSHFKAYEFTDKLGHPLENCQDFIDLIHKAIK